MDINHISKTTGPILTEFTVTVYERVQYDGRHGTKSKCVAREDKGRPIATWRRPLGEKVRSVWKEGQSPLFRTRSTIEHIKYKSVTS